jgi:UDP-glucose:glycoprotein glucosyltransferase
MYERLLRIMMLSVTKRTSAPVKFWLFENYLSPTFKASAAAMADEFDFEIGYVTYKWPEWYEINNNGILASAALKYVRIG